MAGLLAGFYIKGALYDGNTVFDVVDGADLQVSAMAAFELGLRQEVAPRIIIMACNLGIDEAVDGFVADIDGLSLEKHSPCYLLR